MNTLILDIWYFLSQSCCKYDYLKTSKIIWMMGQCFQKVEYLCVIIHVKVILFLQNFAVERIGEQLQIPDACRQFQQGLCNVCDTSIVQLKREVTAMVQSIHQAQTESPVQSGHVITQQPSNRWVYKWNPQRHWATLKYSKAQRTRDVNSYISYFVVTLCYNVNILGWMLHFK